ncbi:restriction endonuclease subunit S [Clostridium butyricum]|uniref:restriction endonuclease subunit S n=1 Tax=Clostridium butyricum TaxID=1492 RepID=UPI0013D189AB|nr:restriction endonuclease subunit S [Clostridium butyricum]MCQ2017654.1 restriction endonuclease subunit S [Clostridium butyricum]MCQ2022642.1 restriction endonuclease subunit S [Clostridium butyricum]NFB91956.1 restriction endonuclease subunit S [Clostridium butyricum]UTY53146.1 restriction endonuclease subunit S [Clostridium butyricum]
MNKNKEKVPKIRFPGFTEPWEQRKLGDMCDEFKSGSSILAKDICEQGEYPVYGGNGLRGYTATYNHDGIYALIGRQGALCGNMNKVYGKAYFTEHAVAVKANKNNNTDFLFFLLDKMNLRQYSGQSAQPGLAVNKLIELITLVPNCSEQKLIGIFFNKLDNLITLHQRKLNHLKDKKKGLLQKMFPKNGELVPELRFPEFTDPWEQRKVGEFLTESKIKGSDGSKAKKLTVKLWRKGIVPKEEIYQGSSATQYYVRKSGQFMYGKLDFLNQAFGIVPPELDGYESTLDSPAFDFKDGINSGFFLEYISLKRFYKYQGNTANGSRKAKRIHADTFFEMPISVPRHDEQKKIGSFFQNIDNLITLHQRKLDHLKEQKKALLQQMFI